MRVLLASVVLAALTRAHGARAEHTVDFRADRVEIAPDAGSLALSGSVVVRLARFRLTSEAVKLSRSPRGVHVEGKGELGLCACAKPPVTFGFQGADLAPPTDVLLQGATLRVASVPVFWSPYLWLRAPERTGVLPPSLAYRGEEGFLVGTGLHFPLEQQPRPRAVDVGVAGYLRGGARVDVLLDTADGRTAVELDYFRGAALDVTSSYSSVGARGQMFAERLDFLRGERAAIAPATLERVTLPSDRLRVGVGVAKSSVFGFAVSGDSPRAQELDELGVLGPLFTLGTGGAIGPRAHYGLALHGQSARLSSGALFAMRAEGSLSSSAALGPLLYEALARQRAETLTVSDAQSFDVRSELRSRLGLPLARRFASLAHVAEPFAEAALGVGVRERATEAALLSDREQPSDSLFALLGLDNALGSNSGPSAVDLRLAGGIARSSSTSRALLAARTRVDAGLGRVSAELRSVPSDASSELSLRTELGAPSSLRLGLRLDGAAGDVRGVHGVWREDFVSPTATLFDRRGFTGGGRLTLPWGRSLSAEVGSDVDISEKRWLASSAAVAYRHPCRCLSLALFGSRRMGRQGLDLGFNLELVPR
jgi:hypothetical protein